MSDKGGHSKPYLNFDQHLNNFFYCKRMTSIMGVVCLWAWFVMKHTHFYLTLVVIETN